MVCVGPGMTGNSAQPSSPRWWRITRRTAAFVLVVGVLFGMAQSASFAMSLPYAEHIAAALAPHRHPFVVQFWTPVPTEDWTRSGPGFLDVCGGFVAMCPWLYLTDLFWFLLIGPGVALAVTALLPNRRLSRHFFSLGVAIVAACALLGVYAIVFVWGTMYPIALAQREIGWIFGLITLAIGAMSISASLPFGRMAWRGLIVATKNPHARAMMSGLWT